MKKLSTFIFCICIAIGYAQKKPKALGKLNPSAIEFVATAGVSSPTSNFTDNSYAGNGSFYELSTNYYFSKIGVGATVGSFSNATDSNYREFANANTFPIATTSETWQSMYYGIGPVYRINFGRFEASAYSRAGIMTVKPISLQGNFVLNDPDLAATIPVLAYNAEEASNIGFYNAGIRFGYKFIPNLGFYISANYISAFSDAIAAQDGKREFIDLDRNGVIDEKDIISQNNDEFPLEFTEKAVQPQVLNYGFGLSYSFGKSIKKVSTNNRSKAGSHTNPYFVSNEMAGEMAIAAPNGGNSGSIAFKNASRTKNQKQRKIISILPKNNSAFKSVDELKKFTWDVVGTKIPNPQFIVEVTHVSNTQQPLRTFIEKSSSLLLVANRIFKEQNAPDGQYRWKVTELTTGITSEVKFFSFSSCQIDFTLDNETIECLGYEQENRKYKICFDATYASTSGDLTFANPGSGLTVFDQTYTALSYTLVSPNPTLLTQIGVSTTTVSYCFEVTVANSVTQIGFGLQGDDLDPSPILCQPGVSLSFEELPDCICDECETIELSFDNFNIGLNGATGNQFNFNGDINVNVPIYGIEFQIQSYTYAANPTACTEGVANVETSGVFLMPGTTINGSSTLQLANETVSGSPSSNDNATKNIKYISNSPISGAIPVNLNVGLPGPISGLDTSCCVMTYTVCVKVKVFYDESKCKSCVFTHCFTFNNQ